MQEEHAAHSKRLLAPLPAGEFVDEPPVIDRFVIQILPGNKLTFLGPPARIEQFLQACAEAGLELHVEYISLCG